MSGSAVSNWDYEDLAAHEERSTIAHELGHALGFPDEYGETVAEASMGAVTFSDKFAPEGRPYMFDVHDVDDGQRKDSGPTVGRLSGTSSMMTHNGVPRARHFLSIADWVRSSCALPPCVLIHTTGERLSHARGLPQTPFEPEFRRLDLRLGGSSLFDAFFYEVGAQTHLGRRFSGPDGAGADALLVLRTKISIDSNRSHGGALRFVPDLFKAAARMSRRLLFHISVVGVDGHVNVAVVWSPRVLWRNYPRYRGETGLDVFNRHLSDLSFRSRENVEYQVTPLADLAEVEAALREELSKNLEIQKDQKDHEARLAVFRASPESDPGGVFSKDTMKRLDDARAREAELREELKNVSSGEHSQETAQEEYEALTAAISAENPPHLVLRPQTAFRVRFLDPDASPRIAECPTSLDTPGIRHRLQCLWAKLFGAGDGRARLRAHERRALALAVFEGTEYEVSNES